MAESVTFVAAKCLTDDPNRLQLFFAMKLVFLKHILGFTNCEAYVIVIVRSHGLRAVLKGHQHQSFYSARAPYALILAKKL